jgi:hypothetical protein
MLTRTLFTVSLLAGLLPLSSFTQNAPHFYVGAGANVFANRPFSEGKYPRVFGPSVTAGLALNPRLAVQLGASYHGKTESVPSYSSGPIQGDDTYRSYYVVMPALLRYTFTSPTSPWHFDGLAGATLVHVAANYTITTNGSQREFTSSDTRANLTLGPALRYTFLPNVEFTANALMSAILGNSYGPFNDRLFLNVLVGAQYSFGKR